MWTKEFWKDTFERVLFTALQAVGAALAMGTVLDLTGTAFLVGVATASALSLVKCLLAVLKTDGVSPASFAKE